jgi:hypothetical protein
MKRTLLAAMMIAAVMSTSGMSGTAAAQFHSIRSVWDDAGWKRMTSDKPLSPNPALEAALKSPTRITFIYNAWHLPSLVKDIRIVDLENHVLGRPLKFEAAWPSQVYSGPGYVALIETSTGELALISAMSQFYLIEYRSRYSVVAKPFPGEKR